MSSKSETGHAVNAANFSRMVVYAENAGAKYNPPDAAISVVNLKLKDQKQQAAIKLLHEKAALWMQAVNEREKVLETLNKLMTKVKNVTIVCNVSPQFIKDVTGLVKKVQGVRISTKIITEPGDPLTPTEESIVQISASKQGIDNRLDNVLMLIELLKTEPNYVPNETELTISALEALLTEANAKNTTVSVTTPPMESARNDRNKEMYMGSGSGADLANKLKAYIKAIFGGNSPEYHNVAKLEFKRLVK
jgi:hypothetical protein